MSQGIPSPDAEWRILVDLGEMLRGVGLDWFTWNLQIHTYAICILLGIVLAIVITEVRLRKRGAEHWLTVDVALPAVLLGIAAARLYHVLTHPDDYFGPGADPLDIVAIWDGGNAIFGALIGGGIGVWLGCRWTGLRFWSFADALAPGLLVAQAVGRLGNYVNQELFGLPTSLPWGLQIDAGNPAIPAGLPVGTLFHPTFLYEMLWNLAGAALLVFVLQKRFTLNWGRSIGFYAIWYGIGRFWFEGIRIDPSEVFLGIRTNQWAALAAVVIGIAVIVVQTRRHTGNEPSVYAPGRQPESRAAVDSDETYPESDDPRAEAERTPAEDVTEKPATSGAVTRP